MPGLESHVGDDDPDGRAGPHAFDGRQESPRTADALRTRHSDQCAVRPGR
jgi:hypothetical protein